ncbi:MAG: enoyl-CoA hydratase/isomerase family protein [Marinobacter sp.]|uniref:enoyl-CoA hydratase/isomerase family protein n=1 Tax=Marinobacter sp. TaxID=50741 RepID=UPI00299ED14B|nr:enoyl-CoA hydratase/isomerase family protein [Marinobacter sp.]MDX1634550.1 enoyl-CoA hydratase/isomerase family protein [Marinobacter sp.]
MTSEPVVFEELATADGGVIGVARLNVPRSLNALSLDIIHLLRDQFDAWAEQDAVRAVWLEGAGDKAFCAGGDIVALYRDMTEPRSDSSRPGVGERFFTDEYQLDYRIHTFPKPVVVWGNGVVMGGGIGLLVGGSHRVVTESSRLAMPEVSIGLYPDVGAGWFLNRMPGRVGLFLGLTGVHMNAADAIFTDLADRFISHDRRDDVMAMLLNTDLTDSAHAGISRVLRQFEAESRDQRPESPVRQHFDQIQRVTDGDSLTEVVDNLQRMAEQEPWFERPAKTVAAASPTAMALHWRHYHRSALDSLAQVLDRELALSLRCLEKGEFAEGVRALLIDKDKQPRWQYPTLESLDEAWVESFFSAP